MSKKQQEKINKANPTLKNGSEQKMTTIKTKQYRKLRSFRFARTFITALTVLTMSVFVAVGTTACDVQNNPNPGPGIVEPDKPNPPDPDQPDKPDPDQPDKPDPDQPDKPDPDQPDKPNPPDPDQPDKPDIDYDKLTPATLTAEQKATIVNNVTTALAKNIQRNIGNTGVVNKVVAVDFEGNYVKLLLDYHNNSYGDMYGFYKYEMKTEMNYKNILTSDISPVSSNGRGTPLLDDFSHTGNDTRVKEVMAKLNPSLNIEECDFTSIVNTSGDIISGVGGTNRVTIHIINNGAVTKIVTNAKSDANYTDPIGQGIINGELGKTYTEPTIESFELGDYALYDFNGLESEVGTTAQTATYAFTVEGKTAERIKNGRYYQEEQE